MKLITDLSESVETLTEEKEGKKTFFIEGIFTGVGTNRNKRIYTEQILKPAVQNFQKLIKEKRACGELSHPTSPTVIPERISHLIERLTWDGPHVIGKAKILNTPMGMIVQGLLEGGVTLGVSTRGLGTVKLNGQGLQEVQNDYSLNAVDIVSDPSYPTAFVNGIMEGVEYFMTEDGKLVEQTQQQINLDIRNKKLTEERKIQHFKSFIDSLTK